MSLMKLCNLQTEEFFAQNLMTLGSLKIILRKLTL